MNARTIWSLLLVAAALFTGCSTKEEADPAPEFELTTEVGEGMPLFVVPDTKVELAYTANHVQHVAAGTLPEGWSVEVLDAEQRIVLTATADAATAATLTLTATGTGSQQAERQVALRCLNTFDDPQGAFVLNEGNMTTENGSLTYMMPEGHVLPDAYRTVNGTQLGNVAQDMAFCGGKIYVISQNGDLNPNGTSFENDGMLVVMDARTLRRTASFTREALSQLDWPTHIAVLDEQHIYLRDNAGIYRLDATTGALTFITGTEGAPKSRFAKIGDKVYTYKSGYISKILEISPESDAVRSISLPVSGVSCDINEVLGIQAADDGRMWVMSFGFGKSAMNKFDLETRKVIQRQVGFKPETGSSGVAFVARGNDIYYADGMTIYHLPFDESADLDAASGLDAEEWMADLSAFDSQAGMCYNGLGVHPVTGRLYANTIRSYALYAQNRIWVFDFAADKESPIATYEDCTRFPAGFYFPENR